MKKSFGLILSSLLFLVSCGSQEDPAVLAASTAKGYYDLLLEGKCGEFVDGTYRQDSIPESYREQLVANMEMYVQQQKDEHQGIKNVRIIDAKADTTIHAATVYLVLSFGDGSDEEVVVPMVQTKGKWKMK